MNRQRRSPGRGHGVPDSLRSWFVAHFIIDVAFALPLAIAPERFLAFLGWATVDPVASRMVAAALFGIGGESWRMRNAGREAYRTMLDLKIIWSLAAEAGLLWSVLTGGPPFGWFLLAIFVGFNVLWIRYRRRI